MRQGGPAADWPGGVGAPQPVAIIRGMGIYRHARSDGTVTVLNATDADNLLHLR